MSDFIQIDGSILEGGGQVLRIAVALGALFKKSIHVNNIRAGRSTPGLRPQHLAGLQLVRDICDGKLTGGEVGSTEIKFRPQKIKCGEFLADPKTAGSIMLLFQVSFPCLLFAPEKTKLRLRGGTNAEFAPQIDHTIKVFKPVIEKMGAKFSCDIIKRGYYPKGGGEAHIDVSPINECLKPIVLLDQGEIVEVFGFAFVAGVLPIKMAHLMADSAERVLKKSLAGLPLKIERIKEPPHAAVGNGSGIVIIAKTSTGCLLGNSALGRRELRPEDVGENTAKELLEDFRSGGCVDQYTQDQLIIFMALAKGTSQVRCGKVTLHTETAIAIAEQLTNVKFQIEKDETSDQAIIKCEGVGLCC